MYFIRKLDSELANWAKETHRKPLLLKLPSFGVGRIRSMFVYPFSFDEFLTASGESILLEAKKNASIQNPLPEPIHQKTLNLLKRFLILVGMPEVVAIYAEKKMYKNVSYV